MQSDVHTRDYNLAFLYYNGRRMEETEHKTYYSGSGIMASTGGREVMVRAQQGDTLHLRTGTMDDGFYDVNICFEFVNF